MNPFPSRKDMADLPDETYLERFPVPPRGAPALFVGYPSTYSVAMSNLGFHFIFAEASRSGEFSVDRFFSDTAPFTFKTGKRLGEADVLFISVSYEEDYINLVRMMTGSAIELSREKRRGKPLIIVGGAAISANPLPLSEMIDVAVIGEGERTTAHILEILSGDGAGEYEDVIEKLSGEDGVFIPGIDSRAMFKKEKTRDVFPHSVILTGKTVFPDTMLFETGRGCPGVCGFCLATSIYRPHRPASLASIVKALDESLVNTSKVGLVSTAITSHPQFEELIDIFKERDIKIGLSSLSAEGIDRKTVRILSDAGVRSASLAPETGDESIRFLIGKRTVDEVYIDAAALLAESGVRRISLYLMTGIPGEDDGIYQSTGGFLERLSTAAPGASFSVHINTMVPKPWTPLQFFAMPDIQVIRSRLKGLSSVCRKAGMRVKTKSIRSSLRQAFLSLGDQRAGRALIEYASGGISWKMALSSAGVDIASVHRERGLDGDLPWYRIEGPSSHDTLLKRYKGMVK
ncbi:MAG: B12-binding domain-containing radical SAM protein [Bacteroidales bacterium]|nr:B12-binding domain-containing radical SAM protein [Candidatus Latescibacterota bacterium]